MKTGTHIRYWKALLKRVKTKVTQRHAQFNRQCLTMAHKHTAQTARLTLGYTRLVACFIRLSRGPLFRKTALPNGAEPIVAHDRIGALFRHSAVHR